MAQLIRLLYISVVYIDPNVDEFAIAECAVMFFLYYLLLATYPVNEIKIVVTLFNVDRRVSVIPFFFFFGLKESLKKLTKIAMRST